MSKGVNYHWLVNGLGVTGFFYPVFLSLGSTGNSLSNASAGLGPAARSGPHQSVDISHPPELRR